MQPFDSECVLLYGYEKCPTVRVERLSLGLECVDMWAKVGTSGVSLVNVVMNLQVP